MSNIDYSQDTKKVLFDMINAENNIQLDFNDFDISSPVIYNSTRNTSNTSVRLTPKAGTGYYGTSEIHYKRLDISEIFDSQVFSYNPQTETTLYDLIPIINSFYGIYLKEEDLINVPIPVYDPLNPTAIRTILVSAQATSYFFKGNFNLSFGITNVSTPEQDGITRTYFLYIDGYGIDEVKKSMISLTYDGFVNNDFNFLINATEIIAFSVDRVEQLKNGWFILNGNFTLTYQDSIQTLVNVTDVKMLKIDGTGFIIETSSLPYFSGTLETLYQNKSDDFKYVIDSTLGDRVNNLYRFNSLTGILDTEFNAAISYIPTMIRVGEDGCIYTVSPVLNIPDVYNNYVLTDQVRIDRILPTGAVDITFNPVYIKSSDTNYQVPDLFDLLPEITGTLLLYFKPVNGLSNTSVVPMVNGNRIVALNAGSSVRYTWNPIIRLNSNGSTDTTFNASLLQFDEGTVMSLPQTVMLVNKRYLISNDDYFVSFTYRQNPLTGYKHVQPLKFDRNGPMHLFAGGYYIEQFNWSALKELVPQSNAVILGYGMLQSFNNNDTLSAPYSALVRYKQDTSVDKVLWRSPGAMGTSNPVLKRLFIKEV